MAALLEILEQETTAQETTAQETEVQDLKKTFQVFSKISESLESSYLELEDRIAQLHLQLENVKADRQKVNHEKHQVADRLNTILNALPAGVVVLDPSGTVKDSNPAAVDLLDGPLTGENWLDVVHRAFDFNVQNGDEVFLQDGRCVTLATCPLGADPGQVILITDVTETKRLQDKLTQHQRLKAIGEMAAGLAHQIRTPLSSAILSCAQLKNSKLPVVKRQATVEKVLTYMGDLEKVVNNMLVFSKSGYAGDEQFRITEVVTDVISTLEPLLEQTKTKVSVENTANITHLVGNRSMLASAIQNIVNNAVQAMGEHGLLDITIQNNQAGTVELVVTDNGPGITEDLRKIIFKPFFTTKSKGTGLGLAIVQAIARAHEGEIWMPEQQPMQGSRFVLRLPAVDVGNN